MRLPFASFWLFVYPVGDLAAALRAAAQVPADTTSLVLDALAGVAFWFGTFLLCSIALSRVDALTGILRIVGAWAIRGVLLLLAGYSLLLWGAVYATGYWPNPAAVSFLLENASRVPQHILQTSPVIASVVVVVTILMAWWTERAVRGLTFKWSTTNSRMTFMAGAVAIGLWSALVPLVGHVSPLVFPVIGSAEEKSDAFARMYVDQLKPKSSGPREFRRPRNIPVVVVLVESLRHDLLVEHPEAIPFLKSLHDRHIGFERAYASASHSNFTDLAFWYSRYPLKSRGKEGFPVDAPWRGTSLFGVFKQAGYATAYISSQNERWGNMQNWLRTVDVDYYYHSEDHSGNTWENHDDLKGLAGMLRNGTATAGKIEDSETLEIAKKWIAGRPDGAFFLGMNLQNTHFSYVMPPGATEPYQPSDLGFAAVYYSWPIEKQRNVRNRYLNAVSNVDRLLANFAEYLQSIGLWDECVFVVLGDNGEAFYEHGFGNHSGPMYDEVVRTLAVIKPPGARASREIVRRPVSHIDIAATVPSLAGLDVSTSFQGLPIIGHDAGCRPVFLYSNAIVRQYGIVDWPWKALLTEYPVQAEELYRLDLDPLEKNNLAATHLGDLARLSGKVRFWRDVQRVYHEADRYVDRVPPRFDDIGRSSGSGCAEPPA